MSPQDFHHDTLCTVVFDSKWKIKVKIQRRRRRRRRRRKEKEEEEEEENNIDPCRRKLLCACPLDHFTFEVQLMVQCLRIRPEYAVSKQWLRVVFTNCFRGETDRPKPWSSYHCATWRTHQLRWVWAVASAYWDVLEQWRQRSFHHAREEGHSFCLLEMGRATISALSGRHVRKLRAKSYPKYFVWIV